MADPLLGICLGLQLLFESSEEGEREGLGLLPGRVERLPDHPRERIPHMGWAPLNPVMDCPLLRRGDPTAWVYFVHSYAAVPSADEDILAATAPFGDRSVTAMVWHNRVGACQFHPEKSADCGSLMLKRWLGWLGQFSLKKAPEISSEMQGQLRLTGGRRLQEPRGRGHGRPPSRFGKRS